MMYIDTLMEVSFLQLVMEDREQGKRGDAIVDSPEMLHQTLASPRL